jgi:hypothetical protein
VFELQAGRRLDAVPAQIKADFHKNQTFFTMVPI